MELNRPRITFASFTALGLNGLVFSFMGVSLPSLQMSLEINIQQAGTLVASLQSGFTICTLFGGILSDHCYRERIIMAGCFILSGSSLLLCIVPSFMLSIIAVCFLGSGIGFILSGTNTLLVNMYPFRKGTILNIHHVFFGIGAIVGPLLMGFLITRGNHWRAGYIGAAAVSLVLCLVFACSKKKMTVSSSTPRWNGRIFALLGDRLFLVILMAGFLTMGSQVVIMLFGAVFLIHAKQCSLAAAGAALSMFSISMVIGRIACSRLALTIKHTSIVLTLLWLQVLILLLMWQGSGWFALVILSLSGFTFSGTYPTLLALTSILFPEYEGTSLGLLSTTGGLGTVVLCWLTGYLAGLTDISTGFIVTLTACSFALIVFQRNYNSISKRELCLKSQHMKGQ
ncbi:MAG: MFS transporter [Desulfocapsaceae bacterium]|jgi:fucose permease|nr:MFS transporter [Desulfocapsaceae bacterium]